MRAIVGAVCFVLHNQRVLLLQRNHGAFLGKWDAPGGLVEFGETPAEAAVRELAEETGVHAESCEQRAQLLLYNVDDGTVVSSYLYVADRWSGEVTESGEGRAEWVPVNRLHATDLIDFMHITLPLVLTPDSLLMGTICHSATGAPVRYELHHHTLSGTRTLRG
ncbi:MAG TPA: NUDIX domain-containing protein [Symbiobacteriaceae bacterium]|nr:NUDIX domain-containing protein [Symbiobacteriaceae bacterium]